MTSTGLILLALGATPAAAEPAFGRRTTSEVRGVDPDAGRFSGDGAYGRFDGDLDLGVGVGPSVAFANGELSLGGRLSAHWFSIAGLYLNYGESLGEAPAVRRRFSGGLDLRPLFLVRWSNALEQGPAILDLTIDSLSLGLGLATSTPGDPTEDARSGFELSLGFGVPLAGLQPGPWLEFRAGFVLPKSEPGDATALALFSWHFALGTPLVSDE